MPPIEALQAWLDALEAFPGVARFLICIEEFERLETLFPGARADPVSSGGRIGDRPGQLLLPQSVERLPRKRSRLPARPRRGPALAG